MITGAMKFFKRQVVRADNNYQATATHGVGHYPALIDEDYRTTGFIESISSQNQDSINVNITYLAGVEIPEKISRIILLDHNLKKFRFWGFNASPLVGTDIDNAPFQSQILGANSNNAVEVSGNDKTISYFEFPETTFRKHFTIQAFETIVPGELRKIGKVILTNEIGTLIGYPEPGQMSFNPNSRTFKSKAGGAFITKQKETLSLGLNFRNYTYEDDIELMHKLNVMDEDFLMWPCGGREENFRYPMKGFRVNDIYKVNTTRPIRTQYLRGSYAGLINATMDFQETA